MAERTLTVDQLTELLERFAVGRAGGRTVEEIADAEVQLLLARIAALTDALRGAEPNEAAHLASRMMLGDLTAVAARFRGRTNTMRPLLTKALAQLHEVAHPRQSPEQ